LEKTRATQWTVSAELVGILSSWPGNADSLSEMVMILSMNCYLDFDPLKCEYAKHNAAIYGVDDKL